MCLSLDLEVKTRTWGQPRIKVDTWPSVFELVLPGQESCSLTVKSDSVTSVQPKVEVKCREAENKSTTNLCLSYSISH